MLNDFSFISHSVAALSFALLGLLVASRYLRRDVDRVLLLACVVSVTWAVALAAQSLWGQPSFFVRYLLELLRDEDWQAGVTGIRHVSAPARPEAAQNR